MGTKNNPGAFDAYAKAMPDETMFTLLGRDPFAASVVRIWAQARQVAGDDPAKVAEAYACADAMDEWCRSVGRDPVNLLAPIDMPPGTKTVMHAVDLRDSEPSKIGQEVFLAAVLPLFQQLTREYDPEGCVRLWAGFLAAIYGAMDANLTNERADGVIAGVRDVSVRAREIRDAAVH
jgi:hypothetical protein